MKDIDLFDLALVHRIFGYQGELFLFCDNKKRFNNILEFSVHCSLLDIACRE